MPAFTRVAIAAILLCPLLVGCGNGAEERSRVEFHTQSARDVIEWLKDIITGPQESVGGRGPDDAIATYSGQLGNVLASLPAAVEAKAETRKAERVVAAKKARDMYEGFRAQLISRKLDKDKAIAKLDELLAILDEVDKP